MKQETIERMQDLYELPGASIETINKFIECKREEKINIYKQKLVINNKTNIIKAWQKELHTKDYGEKSS